MLSIPISFGFALLVAVQTTAEQPAAATPATSTASKTMTVPVPDVADAKRETEQPRKTAATRPSVRQPRPSGRPSFSPSRTRSVAPAPPRRSAADRKTAIIRLEHIPAVDLVEPLTRWLASQPTSSDRHTATIVPVAVTNSLMVSGLPEELEAISTVVKMFDKPVPQFRVTAMLVEVALPDTPKPNTGTPQAVMKGGDIGKVVAELEKRGQLRVLARPELLAKDSQPAFFQSSSREPRVTATSKSSRGVVNNVTFENMGTILGVTGRVKKEDLVDLEIDLERSYFGPDEEGVVVASGADGANVRSPAIRILNLQTSVSLRPGQTAVLGGMLYKSQHGWGELLVLVQIEIVR